MKNYFRENFGGSVAVIDQKTNRQIIVSYVVK